MKKGMETALLPPGFADMLAPDAAREAALIAHFMTISEAWGYQRVKPPLIEFEESLLSGPGAAMRAHTFRLLDPVSHRMLGLRADMTPQIGRIAASRLRNYHRPLRLSYAGQVLRVGQEQLRPARQIGQIGVELIGSNEISADCEILLLAYETLRSSGFKEIVIDLHLPSLLPTLLGAGDHAAILAALDRKDKAEVAKLQGGEKLTALLDCPPLADAAIEYLSHLPFLEAAKDELARLSALIFMVKDSVADIDLTIDPTDHRFFEYHTGLGFTLYAKSVMGELGRGGRYRNHAGEDATGFSFYLDRLLEALPVENRKQRIFLAAGVPYRFVRDLREKGWIVVRGLVAVENAAAEARLLECTHYWMAGEIIKLDQE